MPLNPTDLRDALNQNADNKDVIVVRLHDGQRLTVTDWDFERAPNPDAPSYFIIEVEDYGQ